MAKHATRNSEDSTGLNPGPMMVKISTLGNGLRVVTESVPRVETVSLGVWVDVGTRYETEALHGVSHLLEHMMFKGTGRRSAKDIAEEIEAVGGHLNAFTSREHTTFYAKVMKDDVVLAADLLGDILLHSVFDRGELKREQEVVLQEIGQVQDTPDDLVFDYLQQTAFPNQPLGQNILGTERSILSFTPDHLKTFRAHHYTGPNMVLVAVGNLEHERIVALAEKHFSGPSAKVPKQFAPGRYSGGESKLHRELEQLHLTLGFQSSSYRDPDYFAFHVYTTILGGGMSSRLFQEVREKRGYAYSVYAFNSPLADTGLLGVYAGTGPEYAKDVVPVIAREMKALGGKIPPAEIDRAKAQLKSGLYMALESTSARMEQIGRQMLIYGKPVPLDELVAKVEAVDQAAINRVAAKVLRSPLSCACIGHEEVLPSPDDIRDQFAV